MKQRWTQNLEFAKWKSVTYSINFYLDMKKFFSQKIV